MYARHGNPPFLGLRNFAPNLFPFPRIIQAQNQHFLQLLTFALCKNFRIVPLQIYIYEFVCMPGAMNMTLEMFNFNLLIRLPQCGFENIFSI